MSEHWTLVIYIAVFSIYHLYFSRVYENFSLLVFIYLLSCYLTGKKLRWYILRRFFRQGEFGNNKSCPNIVALLVSMERRKKLKRKSTRWIGFQFEWEGSMDKWNKYETDSDTWNEFGFHFSCCRWEEDLITHCTFCLLFVVNIHTRCTDVYRNDSASCLNPLKFG